MYKNIADSIVRTMAGTAMDLGALEYGAPTTIPAIPYNMEGYSLSQNYPNPFSNKTAITYNILIARQVKVIIYNLTGRKIRILSDGSATAGPHSVEWDGKDDLGKTMESGVYIYQLSDGSGYVVSRKMTFVKK